MLFDATLTLSNLNDVPAAARAAEAAGIDALWTTETQHHPFLPLPLIAEHTARLKFGTAVAIGFARSPTTMAHAAWDLAAQSGGRFVLGLGTQVKAHVERRFGMPWPESAVGKLRDQILALRAVWRAWQTGEKLNFRGEHYKLTLMSPFFNPGPIEHPDVPIFIAGVNPGLCRLAGELADGFHAHPYHTAKYLRETIRPAIEAGARAAGRSLEAVQIATTAFVIGGDEERERVRQQIAFYASTPSYRPVLDAQGRGEVGEALSGLAARGEWTRMPALIDDRILREFAVEAPAAELGAALKEKYDGLADRVALYRPFTAGADPAMWRSIGDALRG